MSKTYKTYPPSFPDFWDEETGTQPLSPPRRRFHPDPKGEKFLQILGVLFDPLTPDEWEALGEWIRQEGVARVWEATKPASSRDPRARSAAFRSRLSRWAERNKERRHGRRRPERRENDRL